MFTLIEASLSKLINPPPDQTLVIIIDALDECGGLEGPLSSDRKALLQALKRWPQLPKHFKLIVTSRGEGDITRILSDICTPIDIPSGNSITDNLKAQASIDASEDIRTFLKERFTEIRVSLTPLPPNWPGEDVIDNMVCRAAGNFMWATTAAKFIESDLDPQDQLSSIMGDTPESLSNPSQSLYSLYSTILTTSFGKFSEDSSRAKMLRAVLGTIVLARRPLHDVEYTRLPTTKPVSLTMVASIRDRLHAVLDQGPSLRFVHKSFDDFLLSNDCPPEYAIKIDETQCLLTELCLTTMSAELCFNICGLETSFLKNVDVPDIETRVRDGVSTLLSYSCCFWADHLVRTPFDEQLMGTVKDMILDKLLYWFEVMSLLKEITRVSHSLLSVLNWSTVCISSSSFHNLPDILQSAPDGKLKDFIRDAHRFIGAFGHPIAQSAPHIYISALPFAPERSSVVRHFLHRFPQTLALSKGQPTDWSPCVFTSEHHEDMIRSVAFLPDEKHFVSGSDDRTICVCDSETGNLVSGPFRCAISALSFFFDPNRQLVWASNSDGRVVGLDIETGDKHLRFCTGAGGDFDVIGCYCFNGGRNIVSVSQLEGTVTLWNADTGKRLQTLFRIPTGTYSRLSFSPDGSHMAWAGDDDTAVRIWKLVDGSEIQRPSHSQTQLGHTRTISALSFSVDGHFVASGSEDGTILIWDAKTGDVVSRPLAISKARVTVIAYSHKCNTLVSASGRPGTVTVWNTSTHEAVLGPLGGHTSEIVAITLSRDGRKALTASLDETVRMWDLSRKGIVPVTHISEADRCFVEWVAFSPCGTKLASVGDDNTIRVWGASTGKCLLDPIDSLSCYRRIIFSPDGSQIVAFCSDDGTIQAWNVDTGEPTFGHDLSDANHSNICIEHVAFRSTDQKLVTCSHHGIVRIWKLEDGVLTEDISGLSPQPEDASNIVWIVALSPDGMAAIVRDINRHFLWSTTTSQPLPLIFTTNKHISGDWVGFSSNGRFFAVASSSAGVTTLRIWNTRTGEFAVGSSSLNRELRCPALSPGGRHIAFSYFSYTDTTSIRILDVYTGHLASGSWKGHTSSITALAFSLDGEKLASVSWDSQIRIWNTADLLGHTQVSVDGFRDETCLENGWAVGESGELLFWVPKDHRRGLFWPRNIAVIGGSGIPTRLDLTRFRYGENWTDCLGGGK
jgi:WD40 repeat protein